MFQFMTLSATVVGVALVVSDSTALLHELPQLEYPLKTTSSMARHSQNSNGLISMLRCVNEFLQLLKTVPIYVT